jgi:DNA-binding transcriptional regulator GbsR (MarR family)
MAGRILGWLLICDPPEQSSTQLAEVLHASKGSISSATRLLLPSGLVQRRSQTGERRDYFRIRPEAWAALVRSRLAEVVSFRELTERGLDLLAEAPKQRRERLEEVHELYAWLAHELPELWQRWEDRGRG